MLNLLLEIINTNITNTLRGIKTLTTDVDAHSYYRRDDHWKFDSLYGGIKQIRDLCDMALKLMDTRYDY